MNTGPISFRRLLSLPIAGDSTTIRAVDVMTDAVGKFQVGDRLWFIADFDVDFDGSGGNPENDPDFQPDTTLHHNGKAINPFEVPGVVLPKLVMRAVGPKVIGCLARLTYLKTGLSAWCVVHDVGPTTKLGEGTPKAARAVGINPHNNGGEDSYDAVLYEVWPGVPAVIDNTTYVLQAAG